MKSKYYIRIPFNNKIKHMELKEIQELVKMFDKSNLGELTIERNDFKIGLKTKDKETIVTTMQTVQAAAYAAPAPIAVSTSEPAPAIAASAAKAESAVSGTVIKSPMIGTFYRSAGPGKDVFVKPGDKITKGQVLCIIEAMKLFNEIESEMDGTLVKIIANDASPVEYDQPLFIIE
jgi:acetyl-CoA carboxylase biotin carboxyl carrier protein